MDAPIDFHRHFSWLKKVNICSPTNNETYQERLLRLEGDKESLVLQVSVLTDQVEAQGEKIRDLESSLEEHRLKLTSTEEMLQQELMSRTSLETQKLDLMDEVSYLKLKLVSMDETTVNGTSTPTPEPGAAKNNKAESVVNLISELQEQMCRFQEEISCRIQEKRAMEEREAGQFPPHRGHSLSFSEPRTSQHSGTHGVHDLLQEVKKLKSRVDELEAEKSQYERKLRATKLSISSSLHVCYQSLMSQLSGLKLTVEHTQLEKQQWEDRWRSAQAEISDLQQLVASKDAEIECLQTQLMARGSSANNSAERDHEYHRLKVGMETLLASNDEKDRRIEELSLLLAQYRKMREIMGLTLGSSEEELSCSPKLRAITHKAHSDIIRSEMSSRGSSPFMLSTSPYQRDLESSFQNSMDVSLVSAGDTSFFNGSWPQHRLLSTSLEELQSGSFKKAIEFQPVETETEVVTENPDMELNKYKTLPGKLRKKKEPNSAREEDVEYQSPVRLSPVHDHDQDYTPRSPGKHDLYDIGRSDKLDECLLSDQSPLSSGVDSGEQSPVSPENRKSHRGIRKLWGKIRRSQSGSPVPAHDADLGDFKRGGFRATAGPRLARPTNARELRGPFSKWTADQVCDWLEDIGLGQYSNSARIWGPNGHTLLSASTQESERELCIKNPLHRKKLQLAIRSFSGKKEEKSADLDYIWVTRWLDDIGLPQYKDQFNEARVDGHMLQYLTVNDLLFLKVTSQLHHLSIKCAIHVLHVNKFNPNCLKRRPSNESQFTPSEVVQWSNHRVMEWLRSVDLAEYAPNLRGSGVHGGLIMLEPRFNSDTLAMLLNIPPQKTLLRRHLNTNFSSLVGPQAQQEKREYTEAPGYTPLSTTAKVKPKKLGFSNLAHLRRRRQDEATDYVCPVDSSSAQSVSNGTHIRAYTGFRGLSPILDREDHTRDQMVPTVETILEIEASSESITNTLTPGARPETRTRSPTEDPPTLILGNQPLIYPQSIMGTLGSKPDQLFSSPFKAVPSRSPSYNKTTTPQKSIFATLRKPPTVKPNDFIPLFNDCVSVAAARTQEYLTFKDPENKFSPSPQALTEIFLMTYISETVIFSLTDTLNCTVMTPGQKILLGADWVWALLDKPTKNPRIQIAVQVLHLPENHGHSKPEETCEESMELAQMNDKNTCEKMVDFCASVGKDCYALFLFMGRKNDKDNIYGVLSNNFHAAIGKCDKIDRALVENFFKGSRYLHTPTGMMQAIISKRNNDPLTLMIKFT